MYIFLNNFSFENFLDHLVKSNVHTKNYKNPICNNNKYNKLLTALITKSTTTTTTSFVCLIIEIIKAIEYNNDNDRIVDCNQLGYFAATHQ